MASSIECAGVSYAHSDSVPLLQRVELRIEPGWTGVVGPNGAGKTTLLRLLAGDLRPEDGAVRTAPRHLRAHLCAQEVERPGPRVRAFAASPESHACRLRGQLRLLPEQVESWGTLSPGERKRWQVGAALADAPGALLLDEPTNHLDAEARDALIAALADFRGIGVVVSHDRELLERLTARTVRVDRGRATAYRGAYDQARSAWEAEAREERGERDKLRHERDKERRRLADKRRARASAESRMRTSRNMKSARDSDARLRGKQKRRRSAEVSLGRDVQLSRRRLERIDAEMDRFQIEEELGRELFAGFEPAVHAYLLQRPAGVLRAGEKTLASLPELALARQARVHLAGANGAGKTTLLGELLERASASARILHLDQELSEERAVALLDGLRARSPEARGRLLQVVAALGVDPGALLASERPSPGEARKLALAEGLAERVHGMVLDEPTNHLDLPSVERIEAALEAYPGALLVVSHDERFASRICSERWTLEDATLRVERTR